MFISTDTYDLISVTYF